MPTNLAGRPLHVSVNQHHYAQAQTKKTAPAAKTEPAPLPSDISGTFERDYSLYLQDETVVLQELYKSWLFYVGVHLEVIPCKQFVDLFKLTLEFDKYRV